MQDSSLNKHPSLGRKSVLKIFDPYYDSPSHTNNTFQNDTKENSEDCDTTFININLSDTFQIDTKEKSEDCDATFVNINNTLNISEPCIQDQNSKECMLNDVENSPNSSQQMCIANCVQKQSIIDVVEMLDEVICNVIEINNNNSMNALAGKNVELKLLLKKGNDEINSLKIRLKMKEELIENTMIECTQYKETLKQLLGEQNEIMQLKETMKTMKLEEEKLLERLETLTKNHISLKKLASEYTNMISKCEAKIEIQKAEYDIAERHLAAIEIAFSDLHNKYEKSKLLIDKYKTNQEILQNSFAEANETLRASEEKYNLLKTHAKTQINKANQQLHSFQEQCDGEIQRLSTMVKRFEIKISFLANSLEQKSEECNKLTLLYNEIAKS